MFHSIGWFVFLFVQDRKIFDLVLGELFFKFVLIYYFWFLLEFLRPNWKKSETQNFFHWFNSAELKKMKLFPLTPFYAFDSIFLFQNFKNLKIFTFLVNWKVCLSKKITQYLSFSSFVEINFVLVCCRRKVNWFFLNLFPKLMRRASKCLCF